MTVRLLLLALVTAACDTGTHTLNAGERRAAIATLARQIETQYIDAAAAPCIAAALRAADYDALDDSALAQRVSRDLLLASHDAGLRVETVAAAPWWRPLHDPAGIAGYRRIGADIGYIDIAAFIAPDRAAARYAKAFGKLADAKTIIVDLRENGGGDADGLQLLSSYVVDRPVHYADLARRDGTVLARWAYPQLAARPYLEQLTILIGPHTGAEAENFAYAMQAWRRATVVGSRSAGVTTASTRYLIAPGLVAVIPAARVTLPLSGASWHGGVTPDVAAADALTEAQRRILYDRLAHVTTPMGRRALLSMLHDLAPH